tara:strand:- start:500 stop:691 length:192 start_codon:yes stop_codon:yes gene_type:complete
MSKSRKKEDLTPNQKPTISRNTAVNKPKYDPDGHMDRRDKDEEDLKAILVDLIQTEIKKLFQK